MIIPYRVDVPMSRWPVANFLLVASIIIAFVIQMAADPADWRGLAAGREQLSGLVTYMWLHGGTFHLVGNLIFLFVFGNAVCAKVGNVFYLVLYVLLGVLSGLAHVVFSEHLAIGASGAINGIVGMFLVFYPRNDISCCLWVFFLYVRTFTVSSFWMILLWLAFDILGAILGGGTTAYHAHIGGFLAGFAIALGLLRVGWIRMEAHEESLVDVFRKKRRRRGVRRASEMPGMAATRGHSDVPMEDEAQATSPVMSEPPIRFRCPCGKEISVGREHAGKIGRCGACGRTLRIPMG